ncbi:MAG: hypothetical protein NC112_06840 [Oxalobacter formigenes]|nr:hypothetical protein [Oxalobacter formigenes]
MRRKIIVLILCLSALFLSGCAVNRATGSVEPGVDLKTIKSIYVKKNHDDNREVNEIFVRKLGSMGIWVKTGEDIPMDVDAVLTYRDKWIWDITMYMLELDVVIRETESNLPMARANSYHTSVTRYSPEEMVDEVINNMFRRKAEKIYSERMP